MESIGVRPGPRLALRNLRCSQKPRERCSGKGHRGRWKRHDAFAAIPTWDLLFVRVGSGGCQLCRPKVSVARRDWPQSGPCDVSSSVPDGRGSAESRT